MKQKVDLLIQFHTLIVLFLCWLVRTDEVVEPDDEMESLTSDVNTLEGEPLQSSARPKDIAGLNVARRQELAETLFKFQRLKLQMKRLVKNANTSALKIVRYRNTFPKTAD